MSVTPKTLDRSIRLAGGELIPSWAVVVETVTLSKIRGTRQGGVVIAMDDNEDFGRSVWVYARYDGNPEQPVYVGNSLNEARTLRDAFVKGHEDRMDRMSHSIAGVRIETPTESVLTVH